MPWTLDVEVESTPLLTTGGHTWAAARRLAAYLSAAAEQLGLGRPGLRVLELGAGTGWLGCTVARNLHQTSLVCLTEQAGGLDWLRHNVHLNRQRGLPLAGVRVQACDWLDYAGSGAADGAAGGSGGGGSSGTGQIGQDSDQLAQTTAGCAAARESAASCSPDACSSEQQQEQHSCTHERLQQQGVGTAGTADGSSEQQVESGAACDLRSTEWDFIFGSDLIYNEVGSRCLPRVLGALVRPCTVALYCHTKHRFDLLDMEFFQELEGCGLQCEEVWEPGMPPPPASPPAQFPPADLFPDQRIAVYRITRRTGSQPGQLSQPAG
ncbi:hypothetical protein ABPG77_010026 [Micractinium sp. CCAP 211/92]